MFKTAATKIAHNSTIPALGGNQDLRPLQDLITAEKAVLISLQKLSVDYSKASEALRNWGLSEGDDLGDILSASTSILNHFSSALSQYATHGHAIREQLKAIRTREESFDDLKRRRRTVLRKAEDAEKKLSKMAPDHKNIAMQTETLHRLRDDIRTMDADIMSEEAALGDFKRTATRMWMGLKFSGLLECCEKGTIAGEYGKLTIAEISEEITQPGWPRSLYHGHSKVEGLVAEAHRCVNEVTLSSVPSVGFRDIRQYAHKHPNPPQIGYGTEVKPQPLALQDDNSSYLQTPIRPFAGNSPFPEKSNSSSLSLATSLSHQPHAPTYQPQLNSPPQQHEGSVDDFGVNVRSTGPDIAGSRYSTFPINTRPPGPIGGYSLQDSPSLGGRHPIGDSSLSASIAEALHEKEVVKPGSLSPWGNRMYGGSESSMGTAGATEDSYHGPPSIERSPVTAPSLQVMADNNKDPLPPPLGAAPPELNNPWANPLPAGSLQAPSHSRQPSQLSDNDDALLAYMTAVDGDDETGETVAPQSVPTVTTTTNEEGLDQHVRSGAVEDIGKPVSLEKEPAVSTHAIDTPPNAPSEGQHPTIIPNKGPRDSLGNGETNRTETNGDTSQQDKPMSRRITPPEIGPTEEEEKALNAAAAREISLEMEALKNDNNQIPPVSTQTNRRSLPDSTPDLGRGRPTTASTVRFNEYPGPPTAPMAVGVRDSAPQAERDLPSHPYAELNPPGVYSSYAAPQQPYVQQPYQPPAISPAQAYAQSYQQQQQQQQQSPSSPPYIQYAQPQAPDTRNTLPPRFQTLNNNMSMDSQVPPRFQAPSSSPIINSLPPRFQTSYAPQVGGVNTPDHDVMPSPYPPRPLASTSPFTKPQGPTTPPLNINTGARTISAAAFKRPVQRNNGSIDSDGHVVGKKMLPAPGNDDVYDYVDAYMDNSNSVPPSPQRLESVVGFGTSSGHGHGHGRMVGSGGYGDVRGSDNGLR